MRRTERPQLARPCFKEGVLRGEIRTCRFLMCALTGKDRAGFRHTHRRPRAVVAGEGIHEFHEDVHDH